MSDIQPKTYIPKDQKFFDYIKEAWDVVEYEEGRPCGEDPLTIFQKLRVVYTHKDNAKLRFELTRNRTILDLDNARDPKAVMVHILDTMHNEIQDEIIKHLTQKED